MRETNDCTASGGYGLFHLNGHLEALNCCNSLPSRAAELLPQIARGVNEWRFEERVSEPCAQ